MAHPTGAVGTAIRAINARSNSHQYVAFHHRSLQVCGAETTTRNLVSIRIELHNKKYSSKAIIVARITLLVLARGASVDKFSNSLSIFEILEGIQPDSFPTVIPKVLVVAMAERSDQHEGVTQATLVFRTEDETLIEGTMEFTFHPNSTGARAVLEMPGLPIITPKDIIVELTPPGGDTASTRLHVRQNAVDRIQLPRKPSAVPQKKKGADKVTR